MLGRCFGKVGPASPQLEKCAATLAAAGMAEPYELTPIRNNFGAEIRGFSLAGDKLLPPEVVNKIIDDMNKYRILVFKGQGQISGARQVEISKQLGRIESTFYKHPRSPHPDIFRVSNDEKEGCTNVGRTGWHIDGTFQDKPFKYQTMHFHSICEGGETWFIPLMEFYEMQDEATKAKWDKYWMITGRQQYAHPLVFNHPTRGDKSLMFHCGEPFCSGWAVDSDDADPAKRKWKEVIDSGVVQAELTQRLNEAVDQIGIKMDWEVGDFAINDNLGNAHYAPPGTQARAAKAGLRILHRTTIAGESVPTKADGRKSTMVN